MKILEEFETIENFPALYFKREKMIIISDLHLGMEGLLRETGVMLPKFQLEEIKKDLGKIIELKKPKRILINGDVKHEFSKTSFSERNEILELFDFLSERIKEIYIVKGNHDNFIYYLVQERENIFLEDYFKFGKVLFMHGHLEIKEEDFEILVIGNEHPALSLKDEVGVKVKLPCFLFGKMDEKRRILVLPSFSKMALGSGVNEENVEFLSPILKKVDIGKLKAIGISDKLLEFPEIGKIQRNFRGNR